MRLAVLAALAALFLSASARAFDPLLTGARTQADGVVLPGDSGPASGLSTAGLPGVLGLLDAVDLALGNNAQLKEAWVRIKIQSAALGQARTGYLPTVTGSGSRVGDGIRYPGSSYPDTWIGSYQAAVEGNWVVFNFGSGFFGDRSAGHLLEAALADRDAALQKALAQVIGAYFEAFKAREVLAGDRRDEEIAQRLLASVKRREERGVGTRGDTLQAETNRLKLVVTANRDEGEYRKDMAVLAYAMGVPVDARFTLPESVPEDMRDTGEDLEGWLADARAAHPAIRSAERQLEAAKDALRAARADSLPSFDFSADYYLNGRPGLQLSAQSSNEILVAGTLNIPLFDGLAGLYKIRDAKARVEFQRAALEDAENDTLKDVVRAYWDTDAAFRNLRASDELLRTAEESLKVSQRRFDKNAANLIELLNAETALEDARQERIRCLADWRSDRLCLIASAGKLGRYAIRE